MLPSLVRPVMFFVLAQIAALAAAAGLIALGASLYLALEPTFGRAGAAAWTAGMLASSAVAIAVIAWLMRTPRRSPWRMEEPESQHLASLVSKELATLSRQHPSAMAAGSLVAGLAVGASPALRRALLSLMSGST